MLFSLSEHNASIVPFFQGYLVNWDIERQVWDHMFGADCCKVKCLLVWIYDGGIFM